MSAHERAAKARARMEQVRREMAERRALRARNARAVRERALESLRRQGPVAAQVAKHMGELGRRRAQAGGWATEKTERDRDYIMGIGTDDEQADARFSFRPSPVPPRVEPATGPVETLPAAAVPPPPPPPPTRRSSREREVLDDEEDFSNQSTWLRNQ
ncbi:hypothetical protein [Actinophytocola xanthii]|uniref:Uncharacterized protein n=1 Tax=Actinophytocola xanthii TaxID=1912961 RepID=A0A1Q8BRX8_9PSEU|nr:hypothetical protein [Actinophytocola xanthii]OLF04859.1 hypothetical protein BU204_37555 [Actinophytocola xanthii]